MRCQLLQGEINRAFILQVAVFASLRPRPDEIDLHLFLAQASLHEAALDAGLVGDEEGEFLPVPFHVVEQAKVVDLGARTLGGDGGRA